MAYFERGGATLVSIEDDIDSAWLTENVSVHLDDFKTHLNGYLSALRPDAPVHSMEEVLASGKYHPGIKENMMMAMKLDVGTPEHDRKLVRQAEVRTCVLKIMADRELEVADRRASCRERV